MYWKGKALYYRAVIGQLVGIGYLPQFHQSVLDSIDAGYGVPDLWLGTYQAQAVVSGHYADFFQERAGQFAHIISELDTEVDDLTVEVDDLTETLESQGWCNTLSVAGAATTAVDSGSTLLNGVPVVGSIADWASDKVTDVAESAILVESVRSGCLGSAASNMGLP